MKKILSVFLFAFALSCSPAAAAAPDAEVKGLWLTCPSFPADAEVLTFEDDTDMDTVTYIRGLDGVLTFEIRRQPLEESGLKEPGHVAELIEMRVNNDDIDEDVLKENLDGIEVIENAEEAARLYSYPCAAAQYTTGANEDTRRNIALFIFTDFYCFEVNFSIAADSAEEYTTGRTQGWLSGLNFVDNGSNDTDAEVTGLWLEIPGFPEDAEGRIIIRDDGRVDYRRTLEDGTFSLTIARAPNDNNGIKPEPDSLGTFIRAKSNTSISEEGININLIEDEDPPFPLAGEYRTVAAQYASGDGSKVNVDFCFFADEIFFWVHMQGTPDAMEKYGNDLENWFTGARIAERK